MTRNLFVLTLLLGGLPMVAEAQVPQARGNNPGRSYRSSIVVRPPGPLTTYVEAEPHHASTVAESWLRGHAAMLRSYGTYLYLRGQGAIGWEQARDHYIRNRQEAVRAWHDLRARNHEIRFGKKSGRSTGVAKSNQNITTPARLAASELSPDGRIYWPDLLMAEEFDGQRKSLDELFRTRAGNVRPVGKMAVRKAIADEAAGLLDQLSNRIREYPTPDYLVARKFIDKLRNEARYDNPVALVRR